MNKKVLYGMLFTSIFILSSVALLAKPALGAKWSFGVPNEAKGIETENEVKIYEKSDWGHAIGNDPDERVNQKHGVYRDGESSSADNVGARTKSKIHDWEKDDIWFLGDYLLYTKLDESIRLDSEYDRTGDGISDLITYWDAVTFARNTILGFGANYGTGEVTIGDAYDAPLIYVMWQVVDNVNKSASGDKITSEMSISINNTEELAYASTYSQAQVAAIFHKEYKGYELERDLWYWAKDGDYDSDADEEDAIVPFIEDPEDLWDSFNYFVGFTELLFDKVEAIIAKMDYWISLVNYSQAVDGKYIYGQDVAWHYLNQSLANIMREYATNYTLYLGDKVTYAAYAGYGLYYQLNQTVWQNFAKDYVYAWYAVVRDKLQSSIIDFFRSKVPDRAEYLIMLLRSGVPAHQPVDNWLEKLVDAFNIPDDVLYGGTDDNFYCDISVDEMQVTVEIEWADGVMWNPGAAVPEERDDYEMVFVYSDTGGQGSMTYQNGDIFYKTESLAPVIPGYEISILLGAAAISAIALIYVVMKKRRV